MQRSKIIGMVGSFAVMSYLVVQTSSATFKAQTENTGNNWAAGTVALTDNDSGTALFNESSLVPTRTGKACIVVTYNGNVTSNVKLRSQLTGGSGLGDYLDLTVERGSGAARDCTDFSSTASVYSGTVADLGTAHTTFSTGTGTWAPTGVSQSMTYRFTWVLQDNNAAQGKDVQSTFTWEAQNS